jgi:hypothetical protein
MAETRRSEQTLPPDIPAMDPERELPAATTRSNPRLNGAAEAIGSALGSATRQVQNARDRFTVIPGGSAQATQHVKQTAQEKMQAAQEKVEEIKERAGAVVEEVRTRATAALEDARVRASRMAKGAKDSASHACHPFQPSAAAGRDRGDWRSGISAGSLLALGKGETWLIKL